MIAIGQLVTDVHTRKVVKIIGFQMIFGITTYQVYDADTDEIYNAAEKALRANSSNHAMEQAAYCQAGKSTG